MFEHDQEIVKSLLNENNDFKRLYDKHGKLKQQLEEAYTKVKPLDDTTMGNLKKEKLYIKDKMATFVENYRQTNTG
jgi:uncharacterized protein